MLKEGGFNMKSRKRIFAKVIKVITEKSLEHDANSTTCMAVYQPKAPESLKRFSKIDDDK